MEDFNGLASSLAAGVGDVRGCLILSRDGLVLGAHPQDGEAQAKPAWMRFAGVGDPERGFAQFGTETWCYVRRGPYAAFAIVGPGARPGLVIDHMEQVLLAAEEARNSREGVRAEPEPAAPPAAPVSKPRTPLHPDRPLEEPVVLTAAASQPVQAEDVPVQGAGTPQSLSAADVARPGVTTEPTEPEAPVPLPAEGSPQAPMAGTTDPPTTPPAPSPPASDTPQGGSEAAWPLDDGDDDVDRFSLAREFSQLLQDEQGGADG